MPSLYTLTGERLALQHKLEELDFDTETIADTLEGESTELTAKIESYGFVIRNLDSFTEAMKAEEKRMAERRKVHENRVEHIKNWLLLNMVACHITKIECPSFTISTKDNPPSVVIDSEELLPTDYWRQPETPPAAPDKKLIAQAIKDGFEVAGAHLERAKSLSIK
jgi:hypothetical protein